MVIGALVLSLVLAKPAMAHVRRGRFHRNHHSARRSNRPEYHAALLMDADSGRVLYAQNSTIQWPPASMAKMMLIAVAEDQIKAGRFSYNDPVRISERAATTGGSRIGLREGQVYPLGELMKAAIIRSANDAAVAVAEKIGGSVEACVLMMNQKAQMLGMDDTYYGTVDGLPPRPEHDVDHTTAIDLAILARDLIHNTSVLRWTSMEQALFDGGPLVLRNTNHLVGHLPGCDGLKTGFTLHAGYNLTATAQRGDMRLISVVLGAPSNPQRFIQSSRLLDWGFDNFTKVHVVSRGDPLPVKVQIQSGPLIQPVVETDVALVLSKNEMAALKLEYDVPQVVDGPLSPGELLGKVVVRDGNDVLTRVGAVSPGAPAGPPAPVDSMAMGRGAQSQTGSVVSAPSGQMPSGQMPLAQAPAAGSESGEIR